MTPTTEPQELNSIAETCGPSVDALLATFELEDQIQIQARAGSARRASVMLEEMLKSPEIADNVELTSFATVIQAQAKSADGSAAVAEDVLQKMRASETAKPTAAVVNAVLDAHAKCADGSAVKAANLLNMMDTEVRLDTISYNTAINAFAKCRDGSARSALDMVSTMRARGVSPNPVTYHSLLDAQARQQDGSADGAIKVIEMMANHAQEAGSTTVGPDLSMFTTAINMQARCRSGSGAGALRLLARMKANGCAPTAVTLNSVIDAQAKQHDGSAKIALTILDAMRRSPVVEVRPTVVTYTSAIDCQAKCRDGDGRTAVALLEEMVAEGLAPNHMTFGCCMNAQAKRGDARMASSILGRMASFGLTPTHVQFNAVLDAQAKCHDGSAVEALLVLEKMKALGAKPNVVSYSTCIDAQAKRQDGSAETAAQLFEEMLAAGIAPDTVTFAGAIDAQAKRKDGSATTAVAILERMVGHVNPNQIHFNSALNACANQRPSNATLAEQVLASSLARGFKPNQYTMSALLRCANFASPPRPDLARAWFAKFAPGLDEINDHVIRALQRALPDECHALLGAAERRGSKLLSSMDASPPTPRRRPSRAGSIGNISPPPGLQLSAPPAMLGGAVQPPPASPTMAKPANTMNQQLHAPVQRRGSRGADLTSNWRNSGPAAPVERRPSSSLFSAPLTRNGSNDGEPTGSGITINTRKGSSTSLLGNPPPQSPGFSSAAASPSRGGSSHSLGGWRRNSAAGLQNVPDMSLASTSRLFAAPRRSQTSENLMSPSRAAANTATAPPMMQRRSTSGNMFDPSTSTVPSDMPVSRTGRRSSSGFNLMAGRTPDRHSNSTSMAGFYAEQQSRTPLVSVNERSMSGLSGLSSALGSKTPRLSLSDKIKAIKLSAGGIPADATDDFAKKGAVARRPSSQLLSPDFFANSPSKTKTTTTTPSTPPTDRKVVRRGSVVRTPSGPDGTKGFMSRRRSSIDAGMLTNSVAVLG